MALTPPLPHLTITSPSFPLENHTSPGRSPAPAVCWLCSVPPPPPGPQTAWPGPRASAALLPCGRAPQSSSICRPMGIDGYGSPGDMAWVLKWGSAGTALHSNRLGICYHRMCMVLTGGFHSYPQRTQMQATPMGRLVDKAGQRMTQPQDTIQVNPRYPH